MGIFHRELFTAFVLMTLATTVVTVPLLQYLQRNEASRPVEVPIAS